MKLRFVGGIEGNIWKQAVILVANKRAFVAILGAYYLTIPSITTQWIGTILFLSQIVGFLLEIPSGYMADKIGHRRGLILSKILTVLSTACYLFADNIGLLVVAGMLMSAGNAFYSGTGSAFLHETLRALDRTREYRGIMGRIGSIGFGVPIIISITVPFLVGISWKLPFLVALCIDLIGVVAAWSLVTPPVTQEHIDEVNATNFLQVLRAGHRLHYFRYALFSGVLGGTIMGIGGFRAVYWDVLGIPVIWYGVLFGIGRALASVLLWKTEWIQSKIGGKPSVYVWKLGLFLSLYIVLGLIDIPWVVALAFILINGFQWGLNQVGYSIEAIAKSKFKATLLSVKAQVNALVFGGTAFVFGWLVMYFSYRESFLIFSGALLVVLIPMLALIFSDAKNKRDGGFNDGDADGGDA